MTIEDDISFFERVPTLSLLGRQALRILAIGAQTRYVHGGEVLFNAGDEADGGFVIFSDNGRQIGVALLNNGAATIDMWCDSVQSQFVVSADTVTVLIGQKTQRNCTPEQARADGELLDALQQATNWKREGDGVVLIGARQLKFRPSTN